MVEVMQWSESLQDVTDLATSFTNIDEVPGGDDPEDDPKKVSNNSDSKEKEKNKENFPKLTSDQTSFLNKYNTLEARQMNKAPLLTEEQRTMLLTPPEDADKETINAIQKLWNIYWKDCTDNNNITDGIYGDKTEYAVADLLNMPYTKTLSTAQRTLTIKNIKGKVTQQGNTSNDIAKDLTIDLTIPNAKDSEITLHIPRLENNTTKTAIKNEIKMKFLKQAKKETDDKIDYVEVQSTESNKIIIAPTTLNGITSTDKDTRKTLTINEKETNNLNFKITSTVHPQAQTKEKEKTQETIHDT